MAAFSAVCYEEDVAFVSQTLQDSSENKLRKKNGRIKENSFWIAAYFKCKRKEEERRKLLVARGGRQEYMEEDKMKTGYWKKVESVLAAVGLFFLACLVSFIISSLVSIAIIKDPPESTTDKLVRIEQRLVEIQYEMGIIENIR